MDHIRSIAFRKYQWHWLMIHGWTIEDLSFIADDWFNVRCADPKNDSPLSDFIFEHGINGSLWVCFDEFMETEYLDNEFMRILLSEIEYKLYCQDIGIEMLQETVYVVKSEASYDCIRDFKINGICRQKEKAKSVLKEAVENSGYFEEAEEPYITEEYAISNEQYDADWEKIMIEEMPLL